MIYTWINFSLGYPCCDINFGRTKNLKITWSFCAKVFKDHLNQAICYLASFKASTAKSITWKIFFDSTKWLKAYETGYPIFINNFSKPERVVCSKCQNCSSIKMTSLKLAESGQFYFHANDRISVCEPKTPEIFLMESITRPCKYELSVRIEVVLNEAIFHKSSS